MLLSLAAAAVIATVPAEVWVMERLEGRFPRPQLPEHVDGIIILGGGLNPVVSAARGIPSINGAAARMTAVLPLARRFPQARIIFTGGSGSALEQRFKESDYVKEFYEEIGFDSARITFESQSRNTRENAVLSKSAMAPKPGETWLLITSAAHMPRAMGCFRAVGWPVLPWPVDYRTTGQGPGWSNLRFSLGSGASGYAAALHELMGLAGYRLWGWTDQLFPHP